MMTKVTVNEYDSIIPNKLEDFFNQCEFNINFKKDSLVLWQVKNKKCLESIDIINGQLKLLINGKLNDSKNGTIASMFFENNSIEYQALSRKLDNYIKMGTIEDYSQILISDNFSKFELFGIENKREPSEI